MKRSEIWLLLFSTVWFGGLAHALAATNEWTKATSGYWEEPYWSLGVLPSTDQQAVAIRNAGWKAVAIGANTTANFPASLTVNDLIIDAPTDSASQLLLNWAGLNVPLMVRSNLVVGTNGSLVSHYSTLVASNTCVDGFAAFMDYATEDFGQVLLRSGCTVGLSNGIMTCSNLMFYTGTFTQSGGMHSVNIINNMADGYNEWYRVGQYELQGGTLISTNVSLGAGGGSYPEGHGVIHQTGGVHTNSGMTLWGWEQHWVTSTLGAYLLDGGMLVSRSVEIACGHFSQAGGTNRIEELGLNGGGFSLSGGVLISSNVSISVGFQTGSLGFNQTGGVHTVQGQLRINSPPAPYPNPSYEIAGGSLIVSNLDITSGEFLLASNASLTAWNVEIGSAGMLHITGGNFINELVTLAGGTLSASASPSFQFGRIQLAGGGSLDVSGTQRFQDSHDVNWSGSLHIRNWSTTDQDHIFIGTNSQGLTSNQLDQIVFIRPSGAPSDYSAAILPTGELVPGAIHDYDYIITNSAIIIADYTGPGGDAVIPSQIKGLPVTTIGPFAFSYCTSLTNVVIPTGVTTIGTHAFSSCWALTHVTIPDSVTDLGEYAFYECYNLANVMIGNGVTGILMYTFAYCDSLTNVTIGNTVSTIGYNAFEYCTRLSNITPLNSVTNIDDYAFSGCDTLKTITFGTGLNNIGVTAFFGSTNLSEIIVDPLNPLYIGLDGVLFNRVEATLVIFPPGKSGSYTIPDGVRTIGAWALSYCPRLTSLTAPNSVTNIADYAVAYCARLTNVTIGQGVKSMGEGAFAGCMNLSAVYFRGDAPSAGAVVFVNDPATVFYLPGTTGWGATFCSRPTAPWYLPNPQILGFGQSFGINSNGFGFIVSWATNVPVAVETSTNLANPKWAALSTNALVNGWHYFADPGSKNHPMRFYRVRSP